jgi:hypothetical protein
MNLERCVDCRRLLSIGRLRKCQSQFYLGKFICKKNFKRECLEVCYMEDPPSEVRKEEAIKRFT